LPLPSRFNSMLICVSRVLRETFVLRMIVSYAD
jgi:hypothetical protein